MDFKDSVKQIAERIENLKENLHTEEATKNALVMPFLTVLGYDVFNPLEVLPEMVCDIGTKKGEKIDYAIMKDGEPIMLIECKHWKQNLSLHDNQLVRYFNVSKAKFGILTNGIIYRFYTDIVATNKMDEKPFLEVNLLELKDEQISELKKFHKSYFDVDTILSTANKLKYIGELRTLIAEEFAKPSPELVKYLGKQVYEGSFTPKVLEQFTELVRRSIHNHINDVISERLSIAINPNESNDNGVTPVETTEDTDNGPQIVTTAEELEGYYTIKSILRTAIDPERITHRDSMSYFAIFVDDNNRKPICRLYFNSKTNKQIGIFNADKVETKFKINSLNDIYQYADQLTEGVNRYL